jgi:hypothetical protein
LAYVVALNGAYTRTACGAIAMALRADLTVPRCPVCNGTGDRLAADPSVGKERRRGVLRS